jgi:excisionase family DNA binding protein
VFPSVPSSAAPGRILRVHHVAKRLGIPARTVRYRAQHGQIPAFKIGPRTWLFYSTDIDAYYVVCGIGPKSA